VVNQLAVLRPPAAAEFGGCISARRFVDVIALIDLAVQLLSFKTDTAITVFQQAWMQPQRLDRRGSISCGQLK